MSDFVLHFGENCTKNNEVTADYIQVCGRFVFIFLETKFKIF